MTKSGIQRVRIYLNGEDWAGDRPLYKAVLAILRQSGATGATVLAALTGFGPQRQVAPEADRQPIVIEWVDTGGRIKRLLPYISELAPRALITVESVEIAQGILRPSGPFDVEMVSDLMQQPAKTITPATPLIEVLEHFVAGRSELLPVIDNDTVIGIISPRELTWRAGLRFSPELLKALEPAEGMEVLEPLKGRTVGEIVNRDVRGIALTTPISRALAVMIEWGYTQVPVVNEQGRLVGMFGHQEILQAAAQQSTSAEQGEVRVRMVMQAATARVTLGQSLAAALAILITAPGHMVFAVDDQQRLVGVLRLTRVLSYVQGDERKLLLAVLRRAQPTPVTALPGARRTIDELVEPSLPAVALDAGLSLAAQQLLVHQAERLPVVDPAGRLSGIIARGALIRALLQQ